MPSSTWYYACNGQKTGPASLDQLGELVATGQFHPTDMVLPAGSLQWVPASSIPGLFLTPLPNQRDGGGQPAAQDDEPVAADAPPASPAAPPAHATAPAMAQPLIYYRHAAGDTLGPLTEQELQAAGLQACSLIWRPGLPGWSAAGTVPEFRELFAAAAGEPSWNLAGDGQPAGPFTLEQLRGLAAGGRLSPGDLTLRVGDATWAIAGAIPGLFPCTEAGPFSVDVEPGGERHTRHRPSLLPRHVPERAWPLYARVRQAFLLPLDELERAANATSGVTDMLEALNPDRFRTACSAALTAVTALGRERHLPRPVRSALLSLGRHRTELLESLEPAARALEKANQRIRELKLPEGRVESFLKGASLGRNPLSYPGAFAVGGAALGNLIPPGVGIAIGGAFGVLVGMRTLRRGEQATLSSANQATNAMWDAVWDLFEQAWNRIGHLSSSSPDADLPDASYFLRAGQRWTALLDRIGPLLQPGKWGADWEELMRFLGEWGAHPGAIELAVTLCLEPRVRDLACAADWADRHLELFPNAQAAHKNRAEVYLEAGDFARSLEVADAGLRIDPPLEALTLVRLEALAALGRPDEALALAEDCYRGGNGGEAWLRHVRGLCRAGRFGEASRAARHWALEFKTCPGVAYCLQADPVVGQDISFLAGVPEFAGFLGEADWVLQGAVESRLGSDWVNSFLGATPPERAPRLRAVLPGVEGGERVLYFLDWSRWYGSGGLVVTTRRVAWKSFWSGTVVVDLAVLSPDQVQLNGAIVTVAGRPVDLREPTMAAAIAAALAELSAAVGRLGHLKGNPAAV